MAETDPTTEPDAEAVRAVAEALARADGDEFVSWLHYEQKARAVLADLRERGWKSPDDLAGLILVPRDGARTKTVRRARAGEWDGATFLPTIRESRTVVYGRWEVAP